MTKQNTSEKLRMKVIGRLLNLVLFLFSFATTAKTYLIEDPFDPPTVGHLIALQTLKVQNPKDEFVVIVQDSKNTHLAPKTRANILKKQLKGNDAFKVMLESELTAKEKGLTALDLGLKSAYQNKNLKQVENISTELLLEESEAAMKERGLRVRSKYNFNNPQLRTLIQFEQLRNDRIENTDQFASIMQYTFDEKYLPENQPLIPMRAALIPLEELDSYMPPNTQIPEENLVVKKGKKYFPFLIHPESEKFFKEKLAPYEWVDDYVATPLSSHRSMVVWKKDGSTKPFGVKISLDAEVGGVRRLLSRNQIERAFAMHTFFSSIPSSELKEKKVHILGEPISFIPKGADAGMTLRDLPPLELGGNKEVVPMFSIYSRGPDNHPKIVDLLKKMELTPKKMAVDFIMEPLLDHYFYFASQFGFVGEPHEQNVLVELEGGKLNGHFYYRDMAGFTAHPDLRALSGKDMYVLPKNVSLKALKYERVGFIDNAVNYLMHSNFYAMMRALESVDETLNKNWLESKFEEIALKKLKKYYNLPAKTKTIAEARGHILDAIADKQKIVVSENECARFYNELGLLIAN